MEQYIIKGGIPLNGEVEIGGAKNAALAILAAANMTDETVRLKIFRTLEISMPFWRQCRTLARVWSVWIVIP